jgi:UDP-N-acetylmuramoylalanine--D-glutamate ligase
MKLSGKRVMVVGLGRSGVAAARFLAARGTQLVLAERNLAVDRAKLPPAEVHLGADDPAWLAGVDLVVTSPGVPRDATLLSEAVARRIPVIGKVELGAQFLRGTMETSASFEARSAPSSYPTTNESVRNRRSAL